MTSAKRTVWIDVDDLFHYVAHNARLSGIQRLTYELYSAIERRAESFGLRTAYLRIDPALDEFVVVDWEDVRALCHGLTTEHPLPQSAQPSPSLPRARGGLVTRARLFSREAALYVNHRLPENAREPFARFRTLQLEALRALAQIRRAGVGTVKQAAGPIVNRADTPVRLLDVAQPGDWLLSLGAPWHRVDYGSLIARARREGGLRSALLIYDLIPLRRPEWCHHSLVETFGAWLDGMLPQCDALFAISDATARDVSDLLQKRGRTDPVVTMPVGTGFPASEAAVVRVHEPVPAHAVPKPGSYVLFVSTIEARKNHALMFQVWRRLAEIMPPERLPTLVFAGRIGWLVSDLMTQIANTSYCDGKLAIIEDPSDAVLMRLYEGCLFTVLPSLFEGWGLPVTESLSFGKPCVTSDTTSLPEAGAGLTRMLDPYDLNDATRVIHEILSDREKLAEWQEEVRRSFKPVPWTRSADAILAGLGGQTVERHGIVVAESAA
ncbi:glycosyltransferase family 4 protein [Acetobacteraceae bacterium KSS8]|uniref:Glycosyltransferase family 4 protein n=1 Tax=Endosaccharibacter trunci TaxID=2812733 RepID=A0ABT1W4Z8_9PROT|nr:glycosyltransferase family 4 protein [Acetobacteraceae bacterium KSS8]